MTTEDRLAAIEARLAQGGDRMDTIEKQLEANTAVTIEVRDILDAIKGGFKFLGWLAIAAKWLGMLAGAAASIYALWYSITHGGRPPAP